jgi:hypothetical protein
MGVWVRYQNKSAIVTVGGKIVAAIKNMSDSIKCEGVVERSFYLFYLFTSFFLLGGVVHHEFGPRGQTVTGQFCLEVMKRLRRHCKGRGLRGGKTRPGCCTRTTHLFTVTLYQ